MLLVLNMNDNELRLLANHMGHDLIIHTTHYAPQTSLIEKAKIAKVLTAVQHGKIGKQATTTEIQQLYVDGSDLWEESGEM